MRQICSQIDSTMSNTNNTFSINSTHQSFTDKQKSLFDQLENVEKNNKQQTWKHDKYYEEEMDVPAERNPVVRERRECKNNRNSRMKQYKCKESIFKRPQAPISKCLPVGRTPDYQKHPKKWTMYTLEDVKDEDMSDRSNTHAALSFLKELERDKGANDTERLESLPEKIVFKKSSMVKKNNECLSAPVDTTTPEEEKPSFRSSKVVMPEYVVGQAVKKEKKKKVRNLGEASSRVLKLDHLDEMDNEDE